MEPSPKASHIPSFCPHPGQKQRRAIWCLGRFHGKSVTQVCFGLGVAGSGVGAYCCPQPWLPPPPLCGATTGGAAGQGAWGGGCGGLRVRGSWDHGPTGAQGWDGQGPQSSPWRRPLLLCTMKTGFFYQQHGSPNQELFPANCWLQKFLRDRVDICSVPGSSKLLLAPITEVEQ